MSREAFRYELQELINRHSQENGSDTPDHILAGYLCACLDAFDHATTARNVSTRKAEDSLPAGTAAPAEPRGDAGSLPSQRLPAEPEPDPTVFAVGYSTYAVDEVHALYKTRELAQAERDRLGGMWEVYEWTVNSTPDNP